MGVLLLPCPSSTLLALSMCVVGVGRGCAINHVRFSALCATDGNGACYAASETWGLSPTGASRIWDPCSHLQPEDSSFSLNIIYDERGFFRLRFTAESSSLPSCWTVPSLPARPALDGNAACYGAFTAGRQVRETGGRRSGRTLGRGASLSQGRLAVQS